MASTPTPEIQMDDHSIDMASPPPPEIQIDDHSIDIDSPPPPEIQIDDHSIDIASPPPLEIEDENSRELYEALRHGEKEKVLQLCQKISDGPFHVVTIHDDTVLHMAASTKQADLVLKLLERVSNDQLNKLTHRNKAGNTILHEASSSDKLVQAAGQMLIKAPELFNMRNNFEVTPLYRSVVYGRMEMFKFLDETFRKQKPTTDTRDLEADPGFYYHRTSKTTVLHRAVANGSFELALFIAKRYTHFVGKQDNEGMTALQLLACNSSAFQKQARCWRVPCWVTIQEDRESYESAVELAKFLIREDKSWMETKEVVNRVVPRSHAYELSSENKENEQELVPNIAETPLFLATKHGCLEIVKEILRVHPWAVEHVDAKGRTILHVAIKYRQMEVLHLVEQMGQLVVKRLQRKIDLESNTILHMVGEKTEDHIVPELRSPALELRDNLLWYERVGDMCPSSSEHTLNKGKKTSQKLFDEENEHLRKKATEWLQRTAQNCSIVGVLIATVAFTAAYTIPGGPNQTTGFPILLNQPLFVVFTLTDVLSLSFALMSVFFFLRILTSSFRFRDFKQRLPRTLMLGFMFLNLSVSIMMLAFAATVVLMIHDRELWTKVALYIAVLLPVTIFTLSYLPLHLSLLKTCICSLKKVTMIIPIFTCYPHKPEPDPKPQASLV